MLFALCLMSIGAPRLQGLNKQAATALVGGTAVLAAAAYYWSTHSQTDSQRSFVSHADLYQRTDIYQVPGVGTDADLMFSWCPEKYRESVQGWVSLHRFAPDSTNVKIISPDLIFAYGATFPTLLRADHDALDMVKRIADSQSKAQPVKILDLGSGRGFMTHCFAFIPKTEIVALDPLKENLQEITFQHESLRLGMRKKAKQVETKEAYWNSLTAKDLAAYKDHFDLIWASKSLHYLGDDIFEGFKRIKWCLKPGGVVIGKIAVPGVEDGLMTGEEAQNNRALVAKTFKERDTFTPGILVLVGGVTDTVNHSTRWTIESAAALKARGAEVGACFTINSNEELGQGVGFKMVTQYYSEEILTYCLKEAGLELVDAYVTDNNDMIVSKDDLNGTELVFVATRPVS